MGTAALGCPVVGNLPVELRSTGRTRASAPTWFVAINFIYQTRQAFSLTIG